jgi:hypothetical protein
MIVTANSAAASNPMPPPVPPIFPQFVARPALPLGTPTVAQQLSGGGPNPPALRPRRLAVAPSNTTGDPSAPPVKLTSEQSRLLTFTNAEIVQYLLTIGNIELPPTTTEPAVKTLFNDLSFAYINGRMADGRLVKTNAQTDALRSILTRTQEFRQAMYDSREAARKWLQAAGENDAMPFLDKAVQECTNSVRKELYNDKPYPAIRISPDTLVQKAHSLRNREIFVRSQIEARSRQVHLRNQQAEDFRIQQREQAAQAEQAEQAAIATTSSFYANCDDSKIAGSQDGPLSPHAPSNAACLRGGDLGWRSKNELLEHGVRSANIVWTVVEPPYVSFLNTRVAASRWGEIDYNNTASGIPTGVKRHYVTNGGGAVLLGPTTYSIDDGRNWLDNPYPTSPAREAIKARESNRLIAQAKARSGKTGCQFPPSIGGK